MAVNTSKVTSAENNGHVEIAPHGSGKVRLPQNAGFQCSVLSTNTTGDVTTFRVDNLLASPNPDFPAGTDQILCDRTTDNQVRKVTLDKIAQYVNSGIAAGPGITVQPGTPPSPASEGDLWYNSASEDGRLYIYFGPDAGGTTQWVDTSPSAPLGQSGTTAMNFPAGAANATYQAPNGVLYSWNTTYTAWQGEGGGGANVEVSPTPPSNPSEGDMWWNSADDSGRLYVYYGPDDSGTEQWVDASPTSTGGGGTNVVFAVNGSTLQSGDYAVVSSAGTTLNLPASPAGGDSLTIVVAGTFTNTVVARNGSNIMSLAEDITLDKEYAAMVFTYVDASNGWRLN